MQSRFILASLRVKEKGQEKTISEFSPRKVLLFLGLTTPSGCALATRRLDGEEVTLASLGYRFMKVQFLPQLCK